MIDAISDHFRYVAVYKDGRLESRSRSGIIDASRAESDRHEELPVNPTLLTLAAQRGNIDCGVLEYLIVRYGRFFQFVLPAAWGHVSVCTKRQPIRSRSACGSKPFWKHDAPTPLPRQALILNLNFRK